MKDQWSGNTLFKLRRTKFDEPSRSSTQRAVPMAACNLAGSMIGARLAVRRGTAFIRGFFLVVITLLIARIAYDLARAL